MPNIVKTHGGRRLGAGRKPGNNMAQPTTVIRVPVNTVKTIKNFVSTLTREHASQTHVAFSGLIQFIRAR